MKAVLVCLLLLIPTVANAQPFGVVMGQKADELQARKTARDFLYHITPSKTHPEMESYVVTATPKQGVCMVRGVGIDHDGDAYGDVIKRIAGELRAQIEATYGPAKLFDHLKYGSIWHEQNDWAMGILKGERSYQLSWENSPSNKLPNDVVEILETVGASSSDSTYVTVQFRFKNFSTCKTEMNGAAAKVF